ncbi:Fe-S cluster assembly protein SufD [Frateuria aurantia]
MSQPQSAPLLASQLAGAEPPTVAEPTWLSELRQSYRQILVDTGMPGPRSETWKYTSLRALAQRSFAMHDAEAASLPLDAGLWQIPELEGPALVFVNGVFRADLSALDALPEGVTLEPVSEVLAAGRGDELRQLWDSEVVDSADVLRRLNASRAHEGVVLRVAAGIEVEPLIRLVHVSAPAAQAQAWHLRSLIQLDEGASLRVVEQHVSSGAHQHLATLTSLHTVAAEARLQLVVLQQTAMGAHLFRHTRFQLASRAEAAIHAVELGGGLVRHELAAQLEGDEAGFDSRGVVVASGRQHIDTQLQLRHAARNSRSDAVWRGVADERSRVVFRGAIVVAEGADGTDASLANKNLLLSAQAEIDSKPELEIYADEVKAAHGATVGQLDERALFYLRSRGIPLEQARRLLMAAFCQEVLDQVPDPALRQHVSSLLLAQLPQDAD